MKKLLVALMAVAVSASALAQNPTFQVLSGTTIRDVVIKPVKEKGETVATYYDATGYGPGTHGNLVWNRFATLAQFDGANRWNVEGGQIIRADAVVKYINEDSDVDGISFTNGGYNAMRSHVRNVGKDAGGFYFSANQNQEIYRTNPVPAADFIFVEDFPYAKAAVAMAEYVAASDALLILSLENPIGRSTGNGHESTAVPCGIFDPENPYTPNTSFPDAAYESFCSSLIDYMVKTGVGVDNLLLIGNSQVFQGRTPVITGAVMPEDPYISNTIFINSDFDRRIRDNSNATGIAAAVAAEIAWDHYEATGETLTGKMLKMAMMERAQMRTVNLYNGAADQFGTQRLVMNVMANLIEAP